MDGIARLKSQRQDVKGKLSEQPVTQGMWQGMRLTVGWNLVFFLLVLCSD